MARLAIMVAVAGLLATQPAKAEWKLKQQYTDGKLTFVSVSSDSQNMPVGLRDSYSAQLSVSCVTGANNLWVQLVWPEPMTALKAIVVLRSVDEFPRLPQSWTASSAKGEVQSFTLDGQTMAGTELMNRLMTSKGAAIALRPEGNGRIQDAIFPLAGLQDKLREVTKACPKWSYFDAREAMGK